MIQEMIRAFLLIFVAEMGDKTQILAMAFATRFPVGKVLLGIGLGAFLNHGLAVLLGSYLSQLVPINTIQMIAGAAFVGFALWTLKPEPEEDEEKETRFQFGPTATVALAFFIGELGDKTQLTAITLAADAGYPLMILAGTVSGMIATGALGIIIGKKLGDKIPELGIKFLAASIFMFFGLQKLYQTVPAQYLSPAYAAPFLCILAAIVAWMVFLLVRRRRDGLRSDFAAKAKMLHDYYLHLKDDLDQICLGSEYCCSCEGDQCAVGMSKAILQAALAEQDSREESRNDGPTHWDKPFTKEAVLDSLVDTLWLISTIRDEDRLTSAHRIRNQLETILLGRAIEEFGDLASYIESVKERDAGLARKIGGMLRMRKPFEERLLNVGNRISNIYLVELQEGYLLIDTGYPEQFERFEKALRKKNIALDDIKYIFITHAHDDHVGFLNRLLERTHAKVILHPETIGRMEAGQNAFRGGCSSRLAWFFCQLMKLFGKGDHRFEPVEASDRYIPVTGNTQQEIEKMLSARIVFLPGHTADSIGLLFDSKALFCGDAAMNGFPSRNHVIIWIEDLDAYKASWEKMTEMNFQKVYPSHGKPFAKEELVRHTERLEKIRLYPLRHA
ncbi:TMEM165/GDT1 family protein [Thermoclostridium caenicola]|uniref:Ca2+/H+ antiporter, TMEM165/GDT1 family n=1 Tax=Thermoclostridium caenicola TaxID=659425 RepID=A0A1M6ALN3_9FIRM|nr:TMEM165/GDT1 family protein [Thermoclostridium caenicola]SHI37419.1 Putative Ca2+/H+ antiporter, TMEM165/GDT1 family [Thermoclostridium caenicola]HPU21544.1 TMEM165/GDT1 family protein [Thermoclostridium caenicola]